MARKYDVIVVGAGPAGSTAARFLADKFKRKVLLIDREKFPRDKPCGGYLTRRIFDRFTYLKKDMLEITEVPTYGSYFYGPTLAKLEWIQDFPVGYLVLRTKFDAYLKDLAVSQGAHAVEGSAVVDLRVKKDEVNIVLENGTSYSAEMVIGADGVRSIIAKKGEIYGKAEMLNKGLCVVQEFEVASEFLDTVYGETRATHYFYGFDEIIGYGWIFPKKNHLNIGMGGPSNSGKEIGQKFPQFIKYLQEENLIPKALKINTKFKAAMIPTSTALYIEKSCADRVLIAGDALGVASSISGEGIYQSMVTGEDAAIIANKALDDRKFDVNYLKQYETLWKKELGRELKTVGNIMQLGSSTNKTDIIKKMILFFEKMQEEEELFNYFARSFFGII